MFKIGDQVEILVNYFREMPAGTDYIRFGTIDSISNSDNGIGIYPFRVAELQMWFGLSELRLIPMEKIK